MPSQTQTCVVHGASRTCTDGKVGWSKHKNLTIAPAIIFVLVWVAVLAGCGSTSVSPPITFSSPSNNDIIEAVRQSVAGHTYKIPVERRRTVTHKCSQVQVDTDPYMPRNPELAKCPSVGRTYSTEESYTDYEMRKCDSLPGSKAGWTVIETSDEHWRVTYAGSTWKVEKLTGSATNIADVIKVSGFSFSIAPQQEC